MQFASAHRALRNACSAAWICRNAFDIGPGARPVAAELGDAVADSGCLIGEEAGAGVGSATELGVVSEVHPGAEASAVAGASIEVALLAVAAGIALAEGTVALDFLGVGQSSDCLQSSKTPSVLDLMVTET